MLGKLGKLFLNLFTVSSSLKHVFFELYLVGPFGCPYPWWRVVYVDHFLDGVLNYQNRAFNGCFPRVG